MRLAFAFFVFMVQTVFAAPSKIFTDADFARLSKQDKTSIIYIWSPHMALSVRGLDDMREMKHPHREIVILMDPTANRAFAEKTAKEHNWPVAVLTTFDSPKLRLAGAGVHYPSYIVISKRKPAGQILPGYKTDEQIESFIRGWKP